MLARRNAPLPVKRVGEPLPSDAAPLLARYDDLSHSRPIKRARGRCGGIASSLPIAESEAPVSLGEGGTPLVPLARLQRRLRCEEVYVKDESQNPTGLFKSRGMSAAVTVAKRLGVTAMVAPSAGDAGGPWRPMERGPVSACASTCRAIRHTCSSRRWRATGPR